VATFLLFLLVSLESLKNVDREIEFDVHVFAEAARVVVAVGFGVAERFQHRIGLEQLVFDRVHFGLLANCGRDELQDFFGSFRFARSGFT
jgi:hypothetical protein